MRKKIVIDIEENIGLYQVTSVLDENLIKYTEIDTDKSIDEFTITELQNKFYKETGVECINSQGEPDIDYMQWLEDKVIKGATEQDLISKAREVHNRSEQLVCPNCKESHSETDCNGFCTAYCLQEYEE